MAEMTNAEILQACHEACGRVMLEKGRAAVSRDRVDACRWDASRGRLSAQVKDYRDEGLAVSVDVVRDRRGIRVEGECDCQDGYNCEHVAAAVLCWLQQRENQDVREDALTSWRRTLRRYHPASGGRGRRHGECLRYEVSMDTTRGEPRLRAEVGRVRRLKKGGFGKLVRISPAEFGSYRLKPLQDEHDADILTLLQAIGSDRTGGYRLALAGELGGLALRRMVETGRCFLSGHESGPLKPGPGRQATVNWQSVEAGVCLSLGFDHGGEAGALTPTIPCFYIDDGDLTCGRVDSELDGPLLSRLVLLPPLSKEDARTIARDLVTDTGLEKLPLPVELDIVRAESVKPVLRLVLLGGAPDERMARVESVYSGHALAHVMADARERIVVPVADGSDVLVSRDVAAELDGIDTLSTQGWRLRRTEDALLALPAEEEGGANRFWADFLDRGAGELEAAGWDVRAGRGFSLRIEKPEAWNLAAEEQPGNDWFSLSLTVTVNGRELPVLPMILEWLAGRGDADTGSIPDHDLVVPLEGDAWVRIPREVLAPVVGTLIELVQGEGHGSDRLHRLHAPLLEDLRQQLREQGAEVGKWAMPEALRDVAERLGGFDGLTQSPPPAGLRGTLRDYQQKGLSWLQFLRRFGFGGVLADDMGLGKTIQVLAHLLLEKESGRQQGPSLVVAPTSLISNWRREAARFTPDLRVLVLHGNERHGLHERMAEYDVVLTTYSLLPRDSEPLLDQAFYCVVLDEAQWIKNPDTKSARTAFELEAAHRICVTGTPLENHLGELWSQFRFLMPGFLGSREEFTRRFRHPIERHGKGIVRDALAARIRPFVLRRTKAQVAAELPEKVEMESLVSLGGAQAALYETVRATMESRVRSALRDSGLGGNHVTVFNALLRLRQVCCDPRLLKIPAARSVAESAKLDMLMEMLPELVADGRRILLFSQFTTMLGLIAAELDQRNISYSKLTGQTRKRDQAIAAFQEGGASVFLVSLKAGGVGLNLTAADTVILYDPWWNPAVERQAIDRAHRIGQDKTVFVYRLIVENSVEERIRALQQRKQALVDAMVVEDGGAMENLGAGDILALFEPGH